MTKFFSQKLAKIILLIVVVAVIAGGVGYGGYYYGVSQQKEMPPPETETTSDLDADFSLFWQAIRTIKGNYVNIGDVSDQDLLYGAIEGVVGSLNDPYSSFLKPSDAQKFEEDIRGSFGGIGAEIGIRKNQLIIVAPLKGNPAEQVGLKAGDKILKVDDTETAGLTVEEAVKLIRGDEGASVRLLILRDTWDEAKEFEITRAIVIVPTLDWEIKDGNVLYIHLQSFNSNANSLLYEAVLSGLLKGADGMVLDLRNNPGGFLDVAIRLAGWFVERGEVVVKEKFADGTNKDFIARGNGALKDFPVVVVVNEGSASASEILAGALRDLRNIKLVGEKTFGKGTVQELENLKDGSVVKISIAEWLTPNGNVINKKGLTPDFEVTMTDKDVENKRDPQLEKAMELLKNEIAKQ